MSDVEAKYAKPERERRFVLAAVPVDADDAREIVDRYIIDTRLRLRSVTSAQGTMHKLGQKIRPDPEDPRLVMHTTMYVSQDEYDLLAGLPANCLRKTRRAVPLEGLSMSVDEFHDVLDGVVTAEVSGLRLLS